MSDIVNINIDFDACLCPRATSYTATLNWISPFRTGQSLTGMIPVGMAVNVELAGVLD
jgi:hypothetical protein